MTDHPIAPMGDAALAAFRTWAESGGEVANCDVRAFLARLDAEIAARKAAEARALPAPRLMRTGEEVEGLPDGRYLICVPNDAELELLTKRDGAWHEIAGDAPLFLGYVVGATVFGPLPDVEPITQEPSHG